MLAQVGRGRSPSSNLFHRPSQGRVCLERGEYGNLYGNLLEERRKKRGEGLLLLKVQVYLCALLACCA